MPVPVNLESKIDVLIIGAGPAGLMAANALGKAGVNLRIIDKRMQKVTAGQADGISPRTIEVFQSYGLGERLLKESCQVHMAAFYNPNNTGGIERTSRAPDVTAPSARYPFEVALHQGGIEAIFLDSMQASGVYVERSIIPTSIELSKNEEELKDPNAYPVKVTLSHLDAAEDQSGIEIVHAKFVLGADGAHSWVRKTFDISMDGEQTEFIWGVIDIVPETDFPDIRNKSLVHSNNGSCLMVPREEDRIRIYMQLADKDVLDPATGRVDKEKMGPEKLLQVAQRSLHPYKLIPTTGIDWWTLYIIGQRVASKFSINDRLFIAGDACHTHSPKAGQGMNASMNDAHNLAWKLVHVLRGWADISILKTYESERQKYARDLIAFDKEFSTLFSGKPRTEENQDGVSHEQFLKAFQMYGGFSSGIGVHYSPSLIVNNKYQSCATKLVAGERVPPQVFIRAADAWPFELQDLLPSDTRYKVIIFTGDYTDSTQRSRVNSLAQEMNDAGSYLTKYSPGGKSSSMFDIITIALGNKEEIDYLEYPAVLRPHWSKVLIDDTDVSGSHGGQGYARYGIDATGAIVLVRPDGYVAMVAPLDKTGDIDEYFASFSKPRL